MFSQKRGAKKLFPGRRGSICDHGEQLTAMLVGQEEEEEEEEEENERKREEEEDISRSSSRNSALGRCGGVVKKSSSHLMHLCCESKSEIFGDFLLRIHPFSAKNISLYISIFQSYYDKNSQIRSLQNFSKEFFLLQFHEVNFSWPFLCLIRSDLRGQISNTMMQK
jgi:hypothetical protein